MAASFPLPVTQDLFALRAKLQELLQFLRKALSISNAHTVDFYTESVWEQLIDLRPDTVLGVLRKSVAEAEARPLEARLLAEAETQSGKGQVGGTGREERQSGLTKRLPSVKKSGNRCAEGRAEAGLRPAEVESDSWRGGPGTFFRVIAIIPGSLCMSQFKKNRKSRGGWCLSNSTISRLEGNKRSNAYRFLMGTAEDKSTLNETPPGSFQMLIMSRKKQLNVIAVVWEAALIQVVRSGRRRQPAVSRRRGFQVPRTAEAPRSGAG